MVVPHSCAPAKLAPSSSVRRRSALRRRERARLWERRQKDGQELNTPSPRTAYMGDACNGEKVSWRQKELHAHVHRDRSRSDRSMPSRRYAANIVTSRSRFS